MSSAYYLTYPLVLILAIFQAAVLPRFPVLGVIPQPHLVMAVAIGLLFGLRNGVIWAFVAGLFVDLFSISPLGISSLALMAAVAIAVYIQQNFPQSRVIMPVLMVAVATVIFWFVDLLLLRIVMPLLATSQEFLGIGALSAGTRAPGLVNEIARGYALSQTNLRLIIVTALVHCLLILPFYWLLLSLSRVLSPRRVEI